MDGDVDADAMVTAIALPVLRYRRAKKGCPLGFANLPWGHLKQHTCWYHI